MAVAALIKNKLDTFGFGKHKGKTARWVIEHDPQYILWCDQQKIVDFSQEIIDAADDNYEPFDYSDPGWDGDVGE